MTTCDICRMTVKYVIHCYIPVTDVGLPLNPYDNKTCEYKEAIVCRGCYDLYRRRNNGARIR